MKETTSTEQVEGGVNGDNIDIYVDSVNITRLVFESWRIDHIIIEVPERLDAPTQAYTLDAYAGYSALLDASKILGSYDFTGYTRAGMTACIVGAWELLEGGGHASGLNLEKRSLAGIPFCNQ